MTRPKAHAAILTAPSLDPLTVLGALQRNEASMSSLMDTLLPGAHVAVITGSPSADLIGLMLRVSGFELRDTLTWYRDGGETLVVLARVPMESTVVNSVRAHGTGALNIDATRVEAEGGRPLRIGDYKQTDNAVWEGRMDGSLQGGSKAVGTTTQGRWPANVLLDDLAAAAMDAQTGVRRASGVYDGDGSRLSDGPGATSFEQAEDRHRPNVMYADEGGASRFFTRANGIDELVSWLEKLIVPTGGRLLNPAGTT